MSDFIMSTVRVSWRITWFLLAVLPGWALKWAHGARRANRGRPVQPLPDPVYQALGLVLALLVCGAMCSLGSLFEGLRWP